MSSLERRPAALDADERSFDLLMKHARLYAKVPGLKAEIKDNPEAVVAGHVVPPGLRTGRHAARDQFVFRLDPGPGRAVRALLTRRWPCTTATASSPASGPVIWPWP